MRIAFSPSIYEHAAFLIGRRPWDVSRHIELLCAGHQRGYELAERVPNPVLLGTGAVPYETPPEHIIAIKNHVQG